MTSRPGLLSARDYLAANFNERISLADGAAFAGLSPFYFQRLFTNAFSETPHEFVTRLRIDHAKKLLLAGNHGVTDTCFDAGYESLDRSARASTRSPGYRQRRSGANRGASLEHRAGTGPCTTCPSVSSNSSPEFTDHSLTVVAR